MTLDRTEQQSTQSRERSQALSRERTGPPSKVPGYSARQFLGSGAYGEVWVGLDENTGRRVAIKFYNHRGGLDWSLLSREVEKLVFLSADRYVVQLLDVGWEADPPYYVMEYVENGSLEDHLAEQGSMPASRAVEMFRDIATGLLHAHGKGVFHCDLKPANILLDQDLKPRIADFGQSRMSHEQSPALGTLFFMAPEQADLDAVPDVRWDVYALGAVLYCMLTGEPPYRSAQAISQMDSTPELPDRLQQYQQLIRNSPAPDRHRQLRGVDRALAEIVDRCLAVNPEDRYANVQSVIDALQVRDVGRQHRPLVILGLVGPLLFLLVTVLFAWRSYHQAVGNSDRLLLQKAQESNRFAADFVAEAVARRLESYFREVEDMAQDPTLRAAFFELIDHSEVTAMLDRLAGNHSSAADPLRNQLVNHPARVAIQQQIERTLASSIRPEIASCFVTDAHGIFVAAAFDAPEMESPIGGDFSYRTYFHGGPNNIKPPTFRHIQETHLSTVFQSTATGAWKMAVSTPLMRDGVFQGIVALTIELGRLENLTGTETDNQQFNVLVDGRDGDSQGVVLQHPLFRTILERQAQLDAELSTSSDYRVPLDEIVDGRLYPDPLGKHALGEAFRRDWIVAKRKVILSPPRSNGNENHKDSLDTGLIVLVQENYDLAAAPIRNLAKSLVRQAALALLGLMLVIGILWYFVSRAMQDASETLRHRTYPSGNSTSLSSIDTIELPSQLRK